MIKIIGLIGSNSVRKLVQATGVQRCSWYTTRKFRPKKFIAPHGADFLFNYGVVGPKLDTFYQKYPYALNIPTFNSNIARIGNKFTANRAVMEQGIRVPISFPGRTSLSREHGAMPPENWIIKPYYSQKGKGIAVWDGGTVPSTHYLQRRVMNRKYEIRVTGFSWVPCKKWPVWKKIKENVDNNDIAWNYDQGGKFIRVNEPLKYRVFNESIANTIKVLNKFNLHFGAVDFIVEEDGSVLFLEVNSRPGFSETFEHVYIDYFKLLFNLNREAMQNEFSKGGRIE